MTFTYPQYLVETAWLEAHLNDPDLRILDCTVLFSSASCRLDSDSAAFTHVPSERLSLS